MVNFKTAKSKVNKSIYGNLAEQHLKYTKNFLENNENSDEYYKYFHKNAFELLDYFLNKTPNKASLFNKYSKNVNNSLYSGKIVQIDENKCDTCNVTIPEINGSKCDVCGIVYKKLIQTTSHNVYPNNQEIEKNQFTYDRRFHFRDLLTQFQGKENNTILPELILRIEKEIEKYHINKCDIHKDDIRKILKRLGLTNLYEHSASILGIINPKNSMTFTREIEDKLLYMFDVIQEPFSVYCPEDRKNILNYNYIFYKFCQILELNKMNIDFENHITLLKCKIKLTQYEKIWKKIINFINNKHSDFDKFDINWVFIPLF